MIDPQLRFFLRQRLRYLLKVVRYFVRSVDADAAADGTAETAALHERLLAYQGVRAAVETLPNEMAITPVLPMHFRKGKIDLRLSTTIATPGTPQDITLQELRVECFFPMDAETAGILRGWRAANVCISKPLFASPPHCGGKSPSAVMQAE
jgi:hypothetical protein